MDPIEELLTRGVEKIYPTKEALEKILRSGKKIRLYQGFDPTGTHLHLGHMVGFRKLQQFQKLGHEVIFLIGDFTGMIGDPSGKSDSRKPLTREEVLENAKNYKEQAKKILDFEGDNPVKLMFNSQWLDKLNYAEVLRLASLVTYAQTIERDMFQKRIKDGNDLYLSEFLYPLMQGYDSIAMDVDLEVGGSDQIFNMLARRDLMKKVKNKEKFVLATKLLAEPGKNKMSKSEGTFVAMDESPTSMFGQIMSWPDDMIPPAFELLTDVLPEEVVNLEKDPLTLKKRLAFEIVVQLHSKESAQKAQEEFEKVVQNQETPSEIEEFQVGEGQTLDDVLASSGAVSSKSEAKRLIEQKAVDIDGETIIDPNYKDFKSGMVIKAGKRKFLKIK